MHRNSLNSLLVFFTQRVFIPLCGGVPVGRIYPFKNETRISNRGGNIFLYVTRAIWKGIRSRFHFGMGIGDCACG